MKNISKHLTAWLTHSIGRKSDFLLMVISHVIFGVLLFFEIEKGPLVLRGVTAIAAITVPVIYLLVLRNIVKQHGKAI
jgi:hypothetical protein